MVVTLGHGIAHAKRPAVIGIGFNDTLVRRREAGFQPSGQRRPKVEADQIKVPKLRVWLVTLGMYLFIEIGVRLGPWLNRNYSSERVLSRWLVKVPMDAQCKLGHRWLCSLVVGLISPVPDLCGFM
jgi:hypothetical protein